MGEYGRTVGETSGAVGGGGGGGSSDPFGAVMSKVSDLFDQIFALPTEIVVVFAAVVIIGGVLMSLRTA
jgi:hypothetical protein